MKIAIIGLGDIATKAYLPLLTRMSELDLVLCTRNPEKLAAVAREYRIAETCTNFRKLVEMNVDGVMIHTNSETHAPIATFFIEQGIPVFVDKPAALNFSDYQKLHDLAEQKSVPLFVGFNRRYIPIWRSLVARDDLRSISWHKHRLNLAGAAQDFVLDDMIHVIDSLNLDGEIDKQDVQISVQRKGGDIAMINLSWEENGTLFSGQMNRQFGKTCESVSLCFENEAYQFDSFLCGEKFENGKTERIEMPDWTDTLETKGFKGMLEDWVRVAKSGKGDEQVQLRNLSTHAFCERLVREISSS
ncbi:Gfo/Idh/MocA family oxidoreductase [Enterovibrio sp. ZSDZ42]|uniref:Gfo/Idh/MocA family oxidoreductase n=1 Tax=Enterovibrio gelatinilyticus TaxID=2899819 RepID=A0ABT5R7L7_9GAMM|nr:Gfo/Idh/MocA family oxidoreductase [Enterovibrio sp. ZSDZ42]MDD1796248.1 Gfo/Idh/MocA family oxidoreductase [Enterovibrio sp. ZSDZ42]